MKIILIDNYDSFTYNLHQALSALGGVDVDVFRNDRVDMDRIGDYDRIVLSPGPGIPCEAGLMPKIIERYVTSKNILGVCLGHQAIAEYFGAKLYNLKKVQHGKVSCITLTQNRDSIFNNLSDTIEVGRYHSWAVSEQSCPPQIEVTARDNDDVIMAFKVKDLPVRGVQFHPESILTPCGNEMLKNWIAVE